MNDTSAMRVRGWENASETSPGPGRCQGPVEELAPAPPIEIVVAGLDAVPGGEARPLLHSVLAGGTASVHQPPTLLAHALEGLAHRQALVAGDAADLVEFGGHRDHAALEARDLEGDGTEAGGQRHHLAR